MTKNNVDCKEEEESILNQIKGDGSLEALISRHKLKGFGQVTRADGRL